MQWREYELRKLQQEGMIVSPPLTNPPVDLSDEQQHVCGVLQEEADETEQDKAQKVSAAFQS